MPKTRPPEPNRNHPLAELTPQRRLWGAYLHRGFDRASFARAMGTQYHTVDAWDCERAMPTLKHWIKAIEVLGGVFSLDDLVYGAEGRPLHGVEPVLDVNGKRALLTRLHASDDERTAFAEHEDTPAGRYQRHTRTYVTQWIRTYSAEIMSGTRPAKAAERALIAAATARKAADATGQKAQPVSLEDLQDDQPTTGAIQRIAPLRPAKKSKTKLKPKASVRLRR